MSPIQDGDYGPEWIKAAFKTELSPLGKDVARLLHDLYSGIYHIQRECSRTNWTNDGYIEIVLRGCWCTFDDDKLTRLVFLAHDYGIRVQMDARSNGYIRIMFHRREREGNLYRRHPSIETALAEWRKYHDDRLKIL